MKILALYDVNDFGWNDALLVALMTILMVFAILFIIILITSGFSKAMHAIDCKNQIMARPENKILDEDNDAVVATLVATIDYHKETGKDCNVISVTRIDD